MSFIKTVKIYMDIATKSYYILWQGDIDFFCLLNSDIKTRALAEPTLLDRVAIHKSIYFASAWANYDTTRKGSLVLSPPLTLLEGLEKDFGLMKEMFFGSIPDWSAILNGIKDFETKFNEK